MSIATIQERFLLTQSGSTKQIYHIILGGIDLPFDVGDSIAIHAQNPPELVERIIKEWGACGAEEIIDKKSGLSISLHDFLSRNANLYKHAPLDIKNMSLQELCNQFSPLLPRFYSIASSPRHAPSEIHLTVALLDFMHEGEKRYGVASYFLSHLAEKGVTPVPFYIQRTKHFRLPTESSADVIMIGPGTGVAPFRAFMQERCFMPGRNWLFFGERQKAHDFLYEAFWMDLVDRGKLRLEVAFSRDQEEKVYVQHKMYMHKKALWEWLNNGAYIYICGDAKRMAKDVDAMWHKIAEEEGNMSAADARHFFMHLRSKDKRYLFDVY